MYRAMAIFCLTLYQIAIITTYPFSILQLKILIAYVLIPFPLMDQIFFTLEFPHDSNLLLFAMLRYTYNVN